MKQTLWLYFVKSLLHALPHRNMQETCLSFYSLSVFVGYWIVVCAPVPSRDCTHYYSLKEPSASSQLFICCPVANGVHKSLGFKMSASFSKSCVTSVTAIQKIFHVNIDLANRCWKWLRSANLHVMRFSGRHTVKYHSTIHHFCECASQMSHDQVYLT